MLEWVDFTISYTYVKIIKSICIIIVIEYGEGLIIFILNISNAPPKHYFTLSQGIFFLVYQIST